MAGETLRVCLSVAGLDPLSVQTEEKSAPCKQRSTVCIGFLLHRVRRHWWAVPFLSKSSYVAMLLVLPSTALRPCSPPSHFVQAEIWLWPLCAAVLELQELLQAAGEQCDPQSARLLPQPVCACARPVPGLRPPKSTFFPICAFPSPVRELVL